MKRILALFLALIMLLSLAACKSGETTVICGNCAEKVSGSSRYCSSCGVRLFQNAGNGIESTNATEGTENSTPPATSPPVTEPPVTEPPVTSPPVTEPPVTEPPATNPPVTEPPVTELPTINENIDVISASKSSLTIDKHTTISIEVTYRESDYPNGISLDAKYNSNIVKIEWGDWDGWTIPLRIIPLRDGTATIRIAVSEDPSEYQDIFVTVTGQNNYQLTIDGVGEQYRLYYSYVLEADVFLLHSADYEITYYASDDTMWVEVEVVVETIENNVINSNYIGIEYELYNDNGVCVQTGNVWIDANYLNRKYSQVLQFFVDAGNYTLVFKDMYM